MAVARKKPNGPLNNRTSHFIMIAILLLIVISIITLWGNVNSPTEFSNSEFMDKLQSGEIISIEVTPIAGDTNQGVKEVEGEYLGGSGSYITYFANDEELNEVRLYALENDITYRLVPGPTTNIMNIIFPILLVVGVVIMIVAMMRGGSKANKQAFDFGKSKAVQSKDEKTTFDDVAGADE